MISDELLAVAASELSAAMAESVSPSDHTFSPVFARKMKLLSRRAAHPARQQVLRYAAAILIAAITAFGGLYLLSPTVRAAVNSWVRTTFGSYIQYYSENTTPPKLEYDYFLPEEFDGYTLVKTVAHETDSSHIYCNGSGQMLTFSYLLGTNNAALFLMDIENHTFFSGAVGSASTDIYIASNDDEANIIVWYDPEDNALFCISAFASKDELITFAEKMQKTEKISN